MSLILTESGQNQNPSFYRNNYKDGILMKAGTEISLVSLSFNKDPTYNIVAGSNDKFRWIIGDTPDFSLHEITVPPGSYSGPDLADELKRLLDESTVLSQYLWTVGFDRTGLEGSGSFTISYTQQEAPDFNENSLSQESGSSTMTFPTNGTTDLTVDGVEGTNNIIDDVPITSSDNIITTDRGIFSNGGSVDFKLLPTDGYPLSSFVAGLISGAGPDIEINDNGVLSTWTITTATGTPATAGWNFQLDDGAGSYKFLYYLPTDEGDIKQSITTATPASFSDDPTIASNWDVEYLYNDTTEDLRDSTAGDRTTSQPLNTGIVLSKWNGASVVPMGLIKAFVGYGQNKFGYVRNDIYQAGTIEPQQNDGFDTMLNVKDNTDKTGILFSLSQMIQNTAIDYPNAGWRGSSKFVFQDKTPSTLDTINTDPTPTNWSTFTYGADSIGVRIEVDRSLSTTVSIYHDDAGDDDVYELQAIAFSGRGDYSFNLKEFMFPLRGCMSVGAGGRYQAKLIEVDGVFDDSVRGNSSLVNDNVLPAGVVLSDEQPAQFVMGPLNSTDIGPNAGQVKTEDAPVPLTKFNINSTLGVKKLYTFPEGEIGHSFSSDQKVVLSIREEALIVELLDFNIQGYNGGNGDTLKIVAVCPREELSTNTSNGTINYYAKFPIYVDLNLINDQKVYDLNVALRNTNGELISDILPNTVATFVIREKEEIKQRRLMREQVELMSGMRASQNQATISQLGRGL